MSPLGEILAATPPFNSSNVPGVFVAGDAGSPLAQVTAAMSSGIMCAGGVSNFLNGLDNQNALQRLRSRSAGP